MLSISQFSKITHITSKTLRYYDEIDLFKPAQVNEENGYRYYDLDQLSTALFIQKLKGYEFSLEDIRQALTGSIDVLALFEKKQTEFEVKLQNYSLLKMAIEKDLKSLIEGGNKMLSKKYEISITDDRVLNILSNRKNIAVQKFGVLLEALFNKIEAEKYTPVGPPMTMYHSPEYTPENYDTEVAVPVAEETAETRSFHTGRCAKLVHKGNYSGLPEAYAYLSKWLEENDFELNGSPFEVYLTDPSTTAPEENIVELCFPVKNK